MSIMYVDCFSGASGDMLLGALIDAGLPLEELEAALQPLDVGFELDCARVTRKGLTGTKLTVRPLDETPPLRHLPQIREIILQSGLLEPVMSRSLSVFERLAQAEAAIHGVPVQEVHFHEVGAVDTLVDVVGFCWALQRLDISAVYVSPLPVGRGTIHTAHGLLPLPAPATLALLKEAHAPIVRRDVNAELVTPTGAALLTTLGTFETPEMRVGQVGYGFGQRELPWANVLRVWLGEPVSDSGPGLERLGDDSAMDSTQHHHHEHGDDATHHEPMHTHSHA